MLRETNRLRLVKDKVITALVRASGLGMLVGLLGIFFYLVSETLPIFSSSSFQQTEIALPVSGEQFIDAGIDSNGDNAFAINNKGEVLYFSIEEKLQLLNKANILKDPVALAKNRSIPWRALINAAGHLEVVMPEFIVSHSEVGRVYTPNLRVDSSLSSLRFENENFNTKTLAVSINHNTAVFARASQSQVEVLSYWFGVDGNKKQRIQVLSANYNDVKNVQFARDGRQMVVLDGQQVLLYTRDKIDADFSLSVGENSAINDGVTTEFKLLHGAKGARVSSLDNRALEFWFVKFQNERPIESAQKFQLPSPVSKIILKHTSKGFWSVNQDGSYSLFYPTKRKPIINIDTGLSVPYLTVLSENDEFLMSIYQDKVVKFKIDAPHPEISLQGLTQKIQYEGYAEPDYVWQTSSSFEDIEPKFSLTPIVFGTLKAAFYAMIFSVPIAVLGAVYTAYFMSSKMRNLIKPTIELMEALPTLVIGFLAAIWLAPIMEKNLLAFLLSIFVIPIAALICGAIWSQFPDDMRARVPKGWHLVILLPALVLVWFALFEFTPYIEKPLFGDGFIYYLADNGWDFQQRNALIVGIAMGFAVIPTIFTISEDAIYSVPKHLSDGSLALGATEWQTLSRVVLLTASPGIISAIMLGLGRAVGETMIVLAVTGNTPITDWNIFEGLRSLTATIAIELPESKVDSSHYRLLFLSALILFLFTFIVNSVAQSVRQRLHDKYRSL